MTKGDNYLSALAWSAAHKGDWPPTKNENGITGKIMSTGCHFCGLVDGRYVNNAPVFVPDCCLNCLHFEEGEYGDYGSRLSPPYCLKNIWLPVRKGTCKIQERIDNDSDL